jgi:hypothetical protein
MANDLGRSGKTPGAKLDELMTLRERMAKLEVELAGESVYTGSYSSGYYAAYYATAGFLLGIFGGLASLMFNVIGSLAWTSISGQEMHPLHLIQVYLTFPMGEQALDINNGTALAIGCVLYLGTGMIYGMLIHLVLTRYFPDASFRKRFAVVSLLSLLIWLVGFYGILSWLQPLLFGGRWIVELVPWWVAALTHLVFGWTMLLVYPWGLFVPYRPAALAKGEGA